MRFMQIWLILQTKKWSEPANNRFFVALVLSIYIIYVRGKLGQGGGGNDIQ